MVKLVPHSFVHKDLYAGTSDDGLVNVGATAAATSPRAAEVHHPPANYSPPFPLLVSVPRQAGQYSVLILQHGFMLQNSFYSQLMQHVSSHGYIVVAPQASRSMYIIAGGDATSEIEHAAMVINWVSKKGQLEASLPLELAKNVRADVGKVVVSGHSRGGKVAFGVGLGKMGEEQSVRAEIAGVVGLDPVDGVSENEQSKPHIVSAEGEGAFGQAFPVLIIGTGLGSEKLNPFTPACAPLNFGHEAFFRCSAALAVHVVAGDYGHMDFLNDSSLGLEGALSHCLCKRGPTRQPLRILSAGLLVAFLKYCIFHNFSTLNKALNHPPFPLTKSQVRKK
ncbi:hypothetical protein L7F22_033485 [Adiantum nelumboides]|nr:hypothetical protein [Adiantum nelumboides]